MQQVCHVMQKVLSRRARFGSSTHYTTARSISRLTPDVRLSAIVETTSTLSTASVVGALIENSEGRTFVSSTTFVVVLEALPIAGPQPVVFELTTTGVESFVAFGRVDHCTANRRNMRCSFRVLCTIWYTLHWHFPPISIRVWMFVDSMKSGGGLFDLTVSGGGG